MIDFGFSYLFSPILVCVRHFDRCLRSISRVPLLGLESVGRHVRDLERTGFLNVFFRALLIRF